MRPRPDKRVKRCLRKHCCLLRQAENPGVAEYRMSTESQKGAKSGKGLALPWDTEQENEGRDDFSRALIRLAFREAQTSAWKPEMLASGVQSGVAARWAAV